MRGIARVVTGGGKTVFAYLCIEEFFSHKRDGRVVIVVPTIALLDQWYVDIVSSLTINENDVVCHSGLSKPSKLGSICIMVLNTARHAAPQLFDRDSRPAFLIVDECHRAGSRMNSMALAGEYAATLGLSATPERDGDSGFEDEIQPALGPIVFEYDYSSAKREGVIVDFDLFNLDLGGASSPGSLHIDEDSLRIAWTVKLLRLFSQQRAIVFHERIEDAMKIVTAVKKFNPSVVAYHSRLSDMQRRDNLRLFRSGTSNVIVTCRALDEGANIPEASLAIVSRSTTSTRQRIQRLGRVLRPALNKDGASVYTLFFGEAARFALSTEAANLVGVANIYWKKASQR